MGPGTSCENAVLSGRSHRRGGSYKDERKNEIDKTINLIDSSELIAI